MESIMTAGKILCMRMNDNGMACGWYPCGSTGFLKTILIFKYICFSAIKESNKTTIVFSFFMLLILLHISYGRLVVLTVNTYWNIAYSGGRRVGQGHGCVSKILSWVYISVTKLAAPLTSKFSTGITSLNTRIIPTNPNLPHHLVPNRPCHHRRNRSRTEACRRGDQTRPPACSTANVLYFLSCVLNYKGDELLEGILLLFAIEPSFYY